MYAHLALQATFFAYRTLFTFRYADPVLGIIILPFTTLIYVLVYAPGSGVTGWGWLWVVLALLLDLGVYSSPARRAVRARSSRTDS